MPFCMLKYEKSYFLVGASSDMQNATQLARAMVEQYGMSEKVFKEFL